MVRLENSEFIKQLEKFLSSKDSKASPPFPTIDLSVKRLTYDESDLHIEPKTSKIADLPRDASTTLVQSEPNTKKYSVLVRVAENKKGKAKQPRLKLSTVVEPENLTEFWNDYTNALKTGFSGLIKKDKKKAKAKK